VHESQKAGTQVQKGIGKANRMLLFIAKGIEYKSREIMLQLYRTLVKLYLGYCVQYGSHLGKM